MIEVNTGLTLNLSWEHAMFLGSSVVLCLFEARFPMEMSSPECTSEGLRFGRRFLCAGCWKCSRIVCIPLAQYYDINYYQKYRNKYFKITRFLLINLFVCGSTKAFPQSFVWPPSPVHYGWNHSIACTQMIKLGSRIINIQLTNQTWKILSFFHVQESSVAKELVCHSRPTETESNIGICDQSIRRTASGFSAVKS